MGAYAPLDWVPPDLVETVMSTVATPTLEEMRRRGTPFAGVLYVGLALTGRGPRVVEFNARFGDPETQVVLPLLETPLAGLLYAAATGTLDRQEPPRWRDGSAVVVVLAADGYPTATRTGDVIEGSEADGVVHAGTARRSDGAIVSAGGRVLGCVGVGQDLTEARARAYELMGQITLDGGHHRSDIALAAEQGRLTN
jgi:phosphoribosylamine--glycine ligase